MNAPATNLAVADERSRQALAQHQSSGRMAVADIIAHVATVQEVMRAVMKKDVHYGVIPGTDKPTLYKAGAEVLSMTFRIADAYDVQDLSTADAIRYRVTCTGRHQITGAVLGSGMGEASSGEEKYKWRKAYEPEYDETPTNMRRKKSGFNKQKKESYSTFQVRTEPADLANTILKMANKRAKMAMVLNVTAASDCFAQDLEDMDEALRDHLTRASAEPSTEPETPTTYPDERFAEKLPGWTTVITSGKQSIDDVIKMIRAKVPLTEAQEATLRAIKVPDKGVVDAEFVAAMDGDQT